MTTLEIKPVEFTGKWTNSETQSNRDGIILELYPEKARQPAKLNRSKSEPNFSSFKKIAASLGFLSESESSGRSPSPHPSTEPSNKYFVLTDVIGRGGEAAVHQAYPYKQPNVIDWDHPVIVKDYQHGTGENEATINALLDVEVKRVIIPETGKYLTILPYHHGETLSEFVQNNALCQEDYTPVNYSTLLGINLYAACLFADYLCLLHRATLKRSVIITHADLKHQNIVVYVDPSILPRKKNKVCTNNQHGPTDATNQANVTNTADRVEQTDVADTTKQAVTVDPADAFKKIKAVTQKKKIDVNIIDYGIASVLRNKHDRVNEKKGTSLYMAHEAILCNGIGIKSDIYSMAGPLLHLLGATRPFEEKIKSLPCHRKAIHPEQTALVCRVPQEYAAEIAVAKTQLNPSGALAWDPAEIRPLLNAFIHRMEDEHYTSRPGAPEVLIFFNSMRLIMQIEDLKLIETTAPSRLTSADTAEHAETSLTGSDDRGHAPDAKKITASTYDNQLIVLKGRLTLLSLDLAKTSINIEGYALNAKGFIAPARDKDKLPPFNLSPMIDDTALIDFCKAINRLHPFTERLNQTNQARKILVNLLNSGKSLAAITAIIDTLPDLLPFIDNFTGRSTTATPSTPYDLPHKLNVTQLLRWFNYPEFHAAIKQVKEQHQTLSVDHLMLVFHAMLSKEKALKELQQLTMTERKQFMNALSLPNRVLPPNVKATLLDYCYQLEDLAMFKARFKKQFESTLFTSIFGSRMYNLITQAKLTSLEQVTLYIDAKSNSRSKQVFESISGQLKSEHSKMFANKLQTSPQNTKHLHTRKMTLPVVC